MVNAPAFQELKAALLLDGFEGPLDLLLQLIEQQRLDITSIALARVADQYLAVVRSATEPNLAKLAEFLRIGARLLLLKTRALLPAAPAETLSLVEEDPAEQLVRQLQEYSRFKQAATTLRERAEAGLRTYVRAAPPALPALPAQDRPPLQVSLAQLVAIVERRLQLMRSDDQETVAVPRPKTLTIVEVTVALRAKLDTHAWMTFDDLLSVAVTRAEVIVTLWTVLELFKRQIITIEQEGLFAQITLGRGPAFGE